MKFGAILPFRSVNQPDRAGYLKQMQRHHLLPQQMLASRALAALLADIDPQSVLMRDFRRNGLLLPCAEYTAIQTALPLHRGPHKSYNAAVLDRVGHIEAQWQRSRRINDVQAAVEAHFRLSLLQRALRRRLMSRRHQRPVLHRNDPLLIQRDYTLLDSLADEMFGA